MNEESARQFINGLPQKLSDELMNYTSDFDRIVTNFIMMDYDWMHYRLQAFFPLKDGPCLGVQFFYFGTLTCSMTVQIAEECIELIFDADIFKKYIQIYLRKQADSFNERYAFYGGNIAMDFYNEVISSYENFRYESVEPIIEPQQ